MKEYYFVLLVVFGVSGCATTKAPLSGLAYSDMQFAGDVTGNTAGGKLGEACASSYFGLVALGDATIESARKSGGINSVTSVDFVTQNYGPFYYKFCTLVRGK